MRFLLALLCVSLSSLADQPVASYSRLCASCGLWGIDTIVSESGQYIVHGMDRRNLFPPPRRENEEPLLELEPQLVAVTAERLKRAFLDDLGTTDSHHDKVHVVLLNRARPEQPIGLVSAVHVDGFRYQLSLPVFLESSRLIKALAQSLLQEYANRGARRNAELPTWLVEGMSRHLLSSILPAPVANAPVGGLQPGAGFNVNQLGMRPMTIERLGYDRLGTTRPFFQTNLPLTIQDLSFNNLGQLNAFERARYESSAHLLVYQLLQLRGGPALMSEFIQALPNALNWQTAFFSVYRQYFRTPLDLEKWWMLGSVEIRSRQAREHWNTPVSLERLEWLLRTPTEFRVSSNAIPQKREITLQEILNSVDFGTQKNLLSQKIQQIFFLSVNLSPAVAPLAVAYEQTIESYLQRRALNDYQPGLKSDPEQRLEALIKGTVQALDNLDRARDEIRAGRTPKLPPPVKRSPGRQMLVSHGNSQK